MGFVVSSFALPIVLARSPDNDPVIQWGACYLILAGNVVYVVKWCTSLYLSARIRVFYEMNGRTKNMQCTD
ncbi:hypothetical protein KM043_011767 [Ampulex compressa]|nr:hypothetical protein KM043_011767 [Ampulex compressa]